MVSDMCFYVSPNLALTEKIQAKLHLKEQTQRIIILSQDFWGVGGGAGWPEHRTEAHMQMSRWLLKERAHQ